MPARTESPGPESPPPAWPAAEVPRLVRDLYGFEAAAEPLESYQDQNFLLRHPVGRRLVLKIANRVEDRATLDLQNRALDWIAAKEPALAVPRVCTTLDGETIAEVVPHGAAPHGGPPFHVRLLTYLPGIPMAAAGAPVSTALLHGLGALLGRLDLALEKFSHPAMDRPLAWDLRRALDVRALLPEVEDGAGRARLEGALDGFESRVLPLFESLPASVIHNDANDHNVLLSEEGDAVASLLDFGDVVHTATVCEPAIAMAYSMQGRADPLEAGLAVLEGYHRTRPLGEAEAAVLFDLIETRLAVNLTHAARNARLRPENAYLQVSAAPGWRLLEQLAEIGRERARSEIAAVCAMRSAPGPGRETLLAARRRNLSPSLSLAYGEPLEIVRGSGAYLFDERGRAYLDCVNNVCCVGHGHPHVVEAASRQMAMLNTNTRYLHENLVAYAEALTGRLPEPLSVCFLVCSGSEANDLALRLARAHTGRRGALVVEGAYHGNTGAVIDLSPYKFDGPGGAGEPEHVQQLPMPDPYRGRHRDAGPEAGARYAAEVEPALERMRAAGCEVAAFFCEPLLGCGGQVVPPPGFLPEAFRSVREAGGVCVADEVQVGFGRPGSHFWAFEALGVVPDIVTLGKPIGNGHPMAAVVTTPEIAAAFANGMEYFNTFGGNPVSAAVGLAVLEVIDREGLQRRALEVGEDLLRRLSALKERHALVGDVRGLGLFLGVELVRDRETLEPAAEEASRAVEGLKERGILLSTDGPLHNVIKIKPPLVFSHAHAARLAGELDDVLGGL